MTAVKMWNGVLVALVQVQAVRVLDQVLVLVIHHLVLVLLHAAVLVLV